MRLESKERESAFRKQRKRRSAFRKQRKANIICELKIEELNLRAVKEAEEEARLFFFHCRS